MIEMLLDDVNSHAVLVWATIIVLLPFLIIGAAVIWEHIRGRHINDFDDFDDPAYWGDQPGAPR